MYKRLLIFVLLIFLLTNTFASGYAPVAFDFENNTWNDYNRTKSDTRESVVWITRSGGSYNVASANSPIAPYNNGVYTGNNSQYMTTSLGGTYFVDDLNYYHDWMSSDSSNRLPFIQYLFNDNNSTQRVYFDWWQGQIRYETCGGSTNNLYAATNGQWYRTGFNYDSSGRQVYVFVVNSSGTTVAQSGWIDISSCDAEKKIKGLYVGQGSGTGTYFYYIDNITFGYESLSAIDANFGWDLNGFSEQLQLTDTSIATDTTITTWQWDINGSTESTDQNFNFDVNVNTDYNVCLTATDGGSISDTYCEVIHVGNFVTADFDYTINKNSSIFFEDTSTTTGNPINSWEWIINGVSKATTQDYNFTTATQLTDYNACLIISNGSSSDMNCQQFQTGDWEAPVTTFTSQSFSGTPITQLRFACTDNNAGCKTTAYRIDSGAWIYVANTGTKDINVTLLGTHTIDYYSSDNSDNNESTKSGSFTKYGYFNVGTYIEPSGAALNGVTMNFNGTDYTLNNTQFIDLNSFPATDTQYTATFSLENYGTRYFSADFNRFAIIDINFIMLPTTEGRSIQFQMYKADETTKYTNTYVRLFNNDVNTWIANQLKTDASGYVTFFLDPNDSAYTMRIYGSDGTVDYNAMTLTVNKPLDETTGIAIDGNWFVDVTGLAWQSYPNLSGATQDIMIYANTADKYGINVGDTNANYYDRKYFVGYVGATTAETLQPYLVPITEAVSTTLYTISGYTQQPVGDIEIRIYKTIAGIGRVLVEQVVTDAKGEALISLIANDEYEFEIYNSANEWLGSQVYAITSTSTTIYISVDDLSLTTPTLGKGYVDVQFTPNRGYLIGIDTTISVIADILDYNYGITFTSMTIWVTNTDVNGVSGNDVNLFVITLTDETRNFDLNTIAMTIDGNTYDNNGVLVFNVLVTTSAGTYFESHTYKPQKGFDWYEAVGYDLRPAFGCSATNDPFIPCPTMLLVALFISFLITIGFAIETGFTGTEGMAAIFLGAMAIFTYLTWVPIGLMALLVVSSIILYIAIGGRNRL